MKTSREIFSYNLRNKLDAKNKKQSELAKFLGVSAVSVSRWVNGDAMPRADMIDGICRFLLCSQEDLMTDHTKVAVMLPQDIIAEEIQNNPRLMRLMFYFMKKSDEELDKEIERLSK